MVRLHRHARVSNIRGGQGCTFMLRPFLKHKGKAALLGRGCTATPERSILQELSLRHVPPAHVPLSIPPATPLVVGPAAHPVQPAQLAAVAVVGTQGNALASPCGQGELCPVGLCLKRSDAVPKPAAFFQAGIGFAAAPAKLLDAASPRSQGLPCYAAAAAAGGGAATP
eukprot:1157385-Pelagomonas_calceolata.AAC.2